MSAKRYSGDAEVRVAYDAPARAYSGYVTDPELHFDGYVPLLRRFERDPTCSEAYDDAARRMFELANRWARRHIGDGFMVEEDHGGRVRVRRGFQAPCPLEDF